MILDASALLAPDRVPEARPDPVREPWDTVPDGLDRQREAAVFGMWLFLASEILFFGAVFLAYAFTRARHPVAFVEGVRHTELAYGAANTAVLLTSSLTATLGVRAAEARARRLAALCLWVTVALGAAFLAAKGLEYRDDIAERLVPGPDFALSAQAQLFFGFYWAMTGIHALHLLAGMGLIARVAWLVGRRRLDGASPQVEAASLFWHLVDAYWMVLFPLLYLAGRA